MSALQLFALEEPDFGPLSLELARGISVLVSDEERLARLAGIFAGVRASRRGRVLLGEDDVYSRPDTRAGLYSLLATEELPAGDVEGVLSKILSWRGSPDSARTLLGAAGLLHYATCDTARLEAEEARAIVLALALGATAPRALVLHDPFSLTPLIDRSFIERRCRTQAEHCPVLILSPALLDAVSLGGSLHLLFGKQWVSAQRLLEGSPSHVVLAVRARQVQELHEALKQRVWVTLVDPASNMLVVQGDDLGNLSQSVIEAALETNITLELLQPLGRIPAFAPGGLTWA